MIDTDRLLQALRHHIGADNGITADALVAEVNASADKPVLNSRELRLLVVELRKLQDQLPAFPDARALIEKELERPIAQLFRELDEKPIAAASVAQVVMK